MFLKTEMAMKIKEETLSADIRAGRLSRVYLIYGKEPFLVSMYTDRIIKKTVGEDALDFNLQRLDECPDAELLSDYAEALPVFAEVKVITVKDPDIEKFDDAKLEAYLNIISDIPETTIIVFFCTGAEPDEKKAKTKKFIAAVDKAGTVCQIELMKPPKIAELCVKKAAKDGIIISQADALYLTERVGGRMSVASDETAKLMSYTGKGGTITRAAIEALVPKQLDAKVFDLANTINYGKKAETFRVIDELFAEQETPVGILSALSGAYLDLYCAKLAKSNGIDPSEAAEMFGYFKGRAWGFINKVYPAAARLEVGYLRETVGLLSDADIKMKSSSVNGRTLIEETVTKLFLCRERRMR